MKLVIVESPAKAKTIEKFLGSDYRVEASYGHIRDLPGSAKEIPEKLRKKSWARLAVTFGGTTDNGLAMKAPAAEIIRIYGEPDGDRVSQANSAFRSIVYYELGLTFTVTDDQLTEINAHAPSSFECYPVER